MNNPTHTCYYCKKKILQINSPLIVYSDKLGYHHLECQAMAVKEAFDKGELFVSGLNSNTKYKVQ